MQRRTHRRIEHHRTFHLLRRGAIAALLPVALVACGAESGSSPKSKPNEGGSGSEVQIRLIAFKPPKLSVTAGTTVTWRQLDPSAHTVTSGTVEQGAGDVNESADGTFASGTLATDKTFEFEFAEPGTYPYFCEIHPATMRGEITVR